MIVRGRGLRWLLVALIAASVFEAGSALVCWLLLSPLHLDHFIWHPDLNQARSNWDSLSQIADKEIGGYTVSGAKPNSEFPDSKNSCGSAFGDSYVGGADVANDEGWVEQLSHLLGCRISNYAVGNYGTDQAYLRFQRVSDASPIVLLGINPNNVMDNINQYDGLLGSALEPTALKGRFLLSPSDHLVWEPRPDLDRDGFIGMHRNPAKTLPHSYFLPDTPDGPITLRFPYSITLARVALMTRLHNILSRRAEWSSLYAAGHPSGALQLMTAICEAFANKARAQGQKPLIIMLPLAHSFRERFNYGEFEYAPLVEALRTKGVDVFDPGPSMIAGLAGRPVCEFYSRPHPETSWIASPVPCGGHYSIVGNTMVARLVADELRKRRYVTR